MFSHCNPKRQINLSIFLNFLCLGAGTSANDLVKPHKSIFKIFISLIALLGSSMFNSYIAVAFIEIQFLNAEPLRRASWLWINGSPRFLNGYTHFNNCLYGN